MQPFFKWFRENKLYVCTHVWWEGAVINDKANVLCAIVATFLKVKFIST